MATGKQGRQQTIATVIALLVVLEIVLHFCFKVLDEALFSNLQITTEIAIISAILLLVVLFFREELVLSSLVDVGKGGRSGKGKKGGGVRNGNRGNRRRR